LLLLGVVLAPAAPGKVYVRWTENKIPPAKLLGVSDLVIPWSPEAAGAAAEAATEGYQVYLEATPEQAGAGVPAGIAGIILQGAASEQSKLEKSAAALRAKNPKLKILVLSANGKQPEMRGWLVFNKNGFLQVSSPSLQPWLDQNLAVVRYERAFDGPQEPLYTFSWDESDPLVKQNGPKAMDYSLAIAEAGAFHADLILPVHERQQKGLANAEKETLADWEPVKRTIAFYDRRKDGQKEVATVGVLTDNYDSSYEAINLMARHNIPFRVLQAAGARTADLAGYEVIVIFAAPGKELAEAIRAFAEQGGAAVLVNEPGTYPWDSPAAGTKNGPSVTYSVGKGRVIELGEPVNDPETFAQDIRRLMVKQQVPVGLWNSLTTLVVEYPAAKAGETVVELVNYDQEATQVQVQVKGIFRSARFESAESGCCELLQTSQVDGSTEFVVPNLVVGGRVRLQRETGQEKTEPKTR
jgi:hypothetical protein